MSKEPKIIYIVSDVRSGSTLLDFLMGRHEKITSVGEFHWLNDSFNNRFSDDDITRGTCSCGEQTPNCDFWFSLEQGLNRTGNSLKELRTFVEVPKGLFAKLWMNFVLIFSKSSSFKKLENEEVIENCQLVFEEIFEQQGTKFILESSKETERALLYKKHLPFECKFIFLVRDSRGVVLSKMKRGLSFYKSTISWFLHNLKQLIVQTSFSKEERIFITYESLCNSPQKELERIFSFLNIENQTSELEYYSSHNIGGSPYRFDKEPLQIKLDEKWKSSFSFLQKAIIMIITGPLNWYFSTIKT